MEVFEMKISRRSYLRSRFGIDVTLEEFRSTILQEGLGGSDGEGEVLDLMEVTAILLIPILLKAAALEQGNSLPDTIVPPPDSLLPTVLRIILHDVTGNSNMEQELSSDFIKRMLRLYGEAEMAEDDNLVQEMIEAAEYSDFDVLALANALTKDVELYDVANEARVSTSIEDVFEKHIVVSEQTKEEDVPVDDKMIADGLVQKPPPREANTLTHIYTAPAIDLQAGTYRSKGTIYLPNLLPPRLFLLLSLSSSVLRT